MNMSTASSTTTSLSTSPMDNYTMALSTPATSIQGDLEHPAYSIASLSLGTLVHHGLPAKIRTASRLGYDAIEIFIPDFDGFVHEVGVGHHSDMFTELEWSTVESTRDIELLCAKTIGRYCHDHGLSISCFQPLREFENFAGASEMARAAGPSRIHPRLKVALDRAENHIRLMPSMGCDLLLVCSNFLPSNPISSTYTREAYRDDQVVAFTELGRLADRYGVRIGHEALAWGTVMNRWEDVWDVVERVDMPNVGVILDSFNQLGQQWADPSEPSGKRPLPASTLTDNLLKLSGTIPVEKIFFYQIADAAKPPAPIASQPTFPSRMAWSRKMRLFPMEAEGYLPVREFTRTLQKMGYKGVWSLEVFNASLDSLDKDTMQTHGQRGIDGLRKLYETISHE